MVKSPLPLFCGEHGYRHNHIEGKACKHQTICHNPRKIPCDVFLPIVFQRKNQPPFIKTILGAAQGKKRHPAAEPICGTAFLRRSAARACRRTIDSCRSASKPRLTSSKLISTAGNHRHNFAQRLPIPSDVRHTVVAKVISSGFINDIAAADTV